MKVTELPAQMGFALAAIVTVTGSIGVTVITAAPDGVPGPFASLTSVRVYVVVDVGETIIIYGLVVIPLTVTEVVPSEYVMLQGRGLVKATVRSVEEPEQIVLVPLKVPVCPHAALTAKSQRPATTRDFLSVGHIFRL